MKITRGKLNDILIFIEKTLLNYDPNRYDHDEHYRYAFLKYLEMIMESLKEINLTPIVIPVYNDIEWDKIKEIIENDLETLKEQIQILIKNYDS